MPRMKNLYGAAEAVPLQIKNLYGAAEAAPLQNRRNQDHSTTNPLGLGCERTEDFGGSDDGIGVDGDGVLDPGGVSAGKSDHDGDVAGASGAEDKFVALLESFDGEVQSAKLIFTKGVGASHVTNEVGLKLAESRAERVVEPS